MTLASSKGLLSLPRGDNGLVSASSAVRAVMGLPAKASAGVADPLRLPRFLVVAALRDIGYQGASRLGTAAWSPFSASTAPFPPAVPAELDSTAEAAIPATAFDLLGDAHGECPGPRAAGLDRSSLIRDPRPFAARCRRAGWRDLARFARASCLRAPSRASARLRPHPRPAGTTTPDADVLCASQTASCPLQAEGPVPAEGPTAASIAAAASGLAASNLLEAAQRNEGLWRCDPPFCPSPLLATASLSRCFLHFPLSVLTAEGAAVEVDGTAIVVSRGGERLVLETEREVCCRQRPYSRTASRRSHMSLLSLPHRPLPAL